MNQNESSQLGSVREAAAVARIEIKGVMRTFAAARQGTVHALGPIELVDWRR